MLNYANLSKGKRQKHKARCFRSIYYLRGFSLILFVVKVTDLIIT